MKQTLTFKQIFETNQAVVNFANYRDADGMPIRCHPKFSFALVKNNKILKTDIDSFNEANAMPKEWHEVQTKIAKLSIEPKEEPKTDDEIAANTLRLEELAAVKEDEATKKLEEEVKVIVEKRTEMLEDEIEVDIHQVKMDYWPEIAPADMATLMSMMWEEV